MINELIGSLLLSAQLISGPCAEKVADTIPFTVAAAPEWTGLFHRDKGWFGADGIFSIPLKGTDSTLLVFSDTMIGDIVDGKLQPGYSMVHNSVAYITGRVPEEKNIRFYYNTDKNGKPVSLFVPRVPHAGPADYYWLGAGFVNTAQQNKTYIFAYRMRNVGAGEWNFKQVGNVLIILPEGSRPPFRNQRQVETPFLISGKEETDNASLGAGIFVNNNDGYVYIYGVKGRAKELIVARVLPENFEQFNEWRFWNGKAWSNKMNEAATVTENVSNELSVSLLPNGKYALLFQVNGMSSKVGLRVGQTPYGPFGPIIEVWDCKEAQHKNYFTYNAKAHPCLSAPGELLISYNVNAFDFFKELNAEPHLYRPRFVILKY